MLGSNGHRKEQGVRETERGLLFRALVLSKRLTLGFMLVKLCSLLPLAIPNFHGRRGQAKTFAPKYCPGGGNIYSLSLAYFPSPRLGAGFGKGGGGRSWGFHDSYITICHYCFSFFAFARLKSSWRRRRLIVYESNNKFMMSFLPMGQSLIMNLTCMMMDNPTLVIKINFVFSHSVLLIRQ